VAESPERRVREPSAAELAALRAWRKQRSRARAWATYRRAAEALDYSEVPVCDGAKPDRYERVTIRTWVESRALLVCEKTSVLEALDEWKDPKHPSFSFTERVSLATTPWLPSGRAVGTLAAHAREARVPIAFFGDLDPQAIHWFATLRAGGRAELLESRRRKLDVAYLGMDSTWLDWLERTAHGLLSSTIALRPVDREYWELVQRLVPDARALVGRRACELLDAGAKIEVDGFVMRHRDAFLRELRRRCR